MVTRVLTKLNKKQINDEAIESFDKYSKSDVDFVFEQGISDNKWIIRHNLNKKPSVTVVDDEERVVVPEIQYVSNNEIILRFNCSFKGKAYLN